jgi:hypothetical protein
VSKLLTAQDIEAAALSLNTEIPVIKAVMEVESRGSGFLPSGKPIILFEGHIFHRYTQGRFSIKYPDISYSVWTKKYYIGGEGEWSRFNKAFSLAPREAMLSTSWGLFQICGFNYRPSGYITVGDFVDAMKISEGEQLRAFITFLRSIGLDDELREKNWAAFALRYNGTGFKKNQYDKKLASAYKKHSI